MVVVHFGLFITLLEAALSIAEGARVCVVAVFVVVVEVVVGIAVTAVGVQGTLVFRLWLIRSSA